MNNNKIISNLFYIFMPLFVYLAASAAFRLILDAQFPEAGTALGQTGQTVLIDCVFIPFFFYLLKKDGTKGIRGCSGNDSDDSKTGSAFRKESAAPSHLTLRGVLARMVLPLAAGSMLSLLAGLLEQVLHLQQYFSNETQEALFSAGLPLQVIGLGILVPVCEELLFRGVVFSRWKRCFGEKSGIWAVSILFALLHGNMIQFLYALPMALLLQLCLKKGKTIWSPVAFHAGANLTSVLVEALI